MKQKVLFFAVILLLVLSNFAYAEDESLLFMSIHFKREQILDKIREVKSEIAKNQETISNAHRIIDLARQKGNTKAEITATEALQKAREALKENEFRLMVLQALKAKIDNLYARFQNEIGNKKIKGVVFDYTGRVEILKANGEKLTPEYGFLEPGDKIWTFDGTATVEMLDGRGETVIGPWSIYKMKEESPAEQVWELIKGKIHAAVEKVEEYKKKMGKEVAEKYRELKIWMCKQVGEGQVKTNDECGFKEYLLRAVFGVRGTEFELERKDDSVVLSVIEGIVEVNFPNENKSYEFKKGEKVEVYFAGTVKK